jgi:DNA-binding winged helix-turn-helix (wHTH) protein
MPDQSLSKPAETPISIGPVVFDRRALQGNGREIRLEPRLGDLLTYLTARQGDVVSRGELIDNIWGDEGSDEALTQAVARLRRSIKDLGGNPDAIETLPKLGYRMRMQTSATAIEASPPPRMQLQLSPLATHGIAFGAGVLVMLLVALAWFAFALKPVTIERDIVLTNPPAATGEH